MYRIIKTVPRCIFGKGSLDQLDEILKPFRSGPDNGIVFMADDYFRDKPLSGRIPAGKHDMLLWINVDDEPKTSVVDNLRDRILSESGFVPAAVVGIGGGSIMDYAKAVSVMITNSGSSVLYQGLNLAKNPAVFHIGIPTLSGTGAEVSMTAVLTGPEKKLGIKGEFTPFDLVVLDPELIRDAPANQRFYTGMDAYIHNVESLCGTSRNCMSDSYAHQSQVLCREAFLGTGLSREEADEKLMIASWFGGLSIGFSEVGVCHALSYGLSYVLGYHHGIANCIAFNQLEDVYGKDTDDFHRMIEIHKIDIPHNISKGFTDNQLLHMAEVSIKLDHMWKHAYGPEWRNVVSIDKIVGWFRKM